MRARQLITALWIVLAGVSANAQNSQDLLAYSITGSYSSNSPRENAAYALMHREVQKLMLEIARQPRDKAYIQRALASSTITLSDLLADGAVRQKGSLYFLNLSLLSRSDELLIAKVFKRLSLSLANAILVHRPEIEAALKQYDSPGVDKRAVAFMVLGCFSLDWDGLQVATDGGFMAQPPVRPGGSFFVQAEEIGGIPLKKLYWMSNNDTRGSITFTTFGDQLSLPRNGFPDEFENISRDRPEILKTYGSRLQSSIGTLLFALRGGPKTAEQLGAILEEPADSTGLLLSYLEGVRYVQKSGAKYEVIIPVLTKQDRQMTSVLLQVGRQVMKSWLSQNYEAISQSMRGISPLRAGVPFPEVFPQLWHYLFGMTNNELVNAGLFSDPYASGALHKGFVPAVFDKALSNP